MLGEVSGVGTLHSPQPSMPQYVMPRLYIMSSSGAFLTSTSNQFKALADGRVSNRWRVAPNLLYSDDPVTERSRCQYSGRRGDYRMERGARVHVLKPHISAAVDELEDRVKIN